MEFLLDHANIEDIRRCIEIYPVAGVTTNPSILKAEGKIDFWKHMNLMRETIGLERSLHVQVVGESHRDMVADAEAILKQIDDKVFIKVPTNEEGLVAMKELIRRGVGVTATAIYSKMQGFMAITAGADYIAPYVNRMQNLDTDPMDCIASYRMMIENEPQANTRIVAASFKNMSQVTNALDAGAHAVTVAPALLDAAFTSEEVSKAVDGFAQDWKAIHGDAGIASL